jgi:hypothetical protein
LKVTIIGKHHLHGYYATIRDVGDVHEMGALSFVVEVDATHRLEKIPTKNLVIRPCVLFFMTVSSVFDSQLYFRNEYYRWFVTQATEQFGFGMVKPSVNPPPPLLHLPPTPLVPSTPIPEGQIFGSPAWQPGSRTPRRSSDEQDEQQKRPSDCRDARIPKPPGKAGRSVGWLQQALKVDPDVFTQMRVSRNRCHRFSFNIPLERFRCTGGATFRSRFLLYEANQASRRRCIGGGTWFLMSLRGRH